jgi:uncharacterized membrane protein (GlpM family)
VRAAQNNLSAANNKFASFPGDTFRQRGILMMQFVFRFLVGGTIVSLFAVLGDILKPKSFAGLFGAAPSVALATLGLTILADGKVYAATEARSMIAGAAAFFVYAFMCCQIMMRYRIRAAFATIGLIPLWFAIAFGLSLGFRR